MDAITAYKAELLDMLAYGKSLNSLCDFLENAINCPVAICLATETIIATSKGYTHELIQEYVDSPKKYDVNDSVNSQKMLDMVYADCKAHLIYFPYLHDKRILCGCNHEGERLAVFDIVVRNTEPSEEYMRLVEFVASYLVLFMKINGFLTSGNRNISIQNLILGIINGTIMPENQRYNISNSRFFGIQEWRLVWITKDKSEAEDFYKAANMRSEALSRICAGEYGWWDVPYRTQDMAGDLLLLDNNSRQHLKRLESFCGQYECFANVSHSFSSLTDLPEVFKELRYMHLCFTDFDELQPIRYYDDYKIRVILAGLYLDGKEDFYQIPLLDNIIKYDLEHSTNYYITLETFLKCHANYKNTADKLFIHVNTVMYRIRRLSELFGINFGDFSTMSDLYYSMMLRKLVARTKKMIGESK